MTDFEDSLRAKLERNAEIAAQRAEAEQEMDRAKQRAEEAERLRLAELAEARNKRHAQLAAVCKDLADHLKASAPDQFIVRTGWTSSGEEFIAKISTRQLTPARTLFIELDRDDDEVLARWHSTVGESLELYHLLEFDEHMLEELVLQVIDDELWNRATTTPRFPGNPS